MDVLDQLNATDALDDQVPEDGAIDDLATPSGPG